MMMGQFSHQPPSSVPPSGVMVSGPPMAPPHVTPPHQAQHNPIISVAPMQPHSHSSHANGQPMQAGSHGGGHSLGPHSHIGAAGHHHQLGHTTGQGGGDYHHHHSVPPPPTFAPPGPPAGPPHPAQAGPPQFPMMGGGGGHHPGPPGGQGLPLELANIKEKTPMCLVNELARFNKVQHQYRLTDESGPAHKKTFTVNLKIGDTEEYVASGPSIKKAQHAAAAIALEKTQFKHPSPRARNTKNANVTPTVELNALAMKRGEPTTYIFLEPNRANTNQYPPSHPSINFRGMYNQRYHCGRGPGSPPVFHVQLRVGNREFTGEGATAQAAKHGAAGKALKMLKELPMPDGKSKLDPTTLPFVPDLTNASSEYDELKSPISLVHEVALKRNLQVHFEVTRETGPPHMRTFITKCLVGEFITEGEGNGKKVSKKRAAELMLDQLKHLPPVASASVPKVRKPLAGKKKSRNLIKVEQKENPEYGQSINPISRLIQIQQARKEKEPQYTLVAETGMPRRREFVMQVTVGQHSSTGSGPNKKLAKRAAAEALLQLLGYSRPTPQPNKPSLKSPGGSSSSEGVGERNKKLTFVDEVNPEDSSSSAAGPAAGATAAGGGQQGPAAAAGQGSASRQLVPGLIYIDKGASKQQQYKQQPQTNGVMTNGVAATSTGGQPGTTQAATIAKELLNAGTSPTADALAKKTQPLPAAAAIPVNVPPTSGQGVSAKEQLAYLSQVLGFAVTYTDFPKKGEYLSLVSLSTNPPQVSHGAGATLEGSHNNAAHTALKTLASNGLDTVVENGQGKGPHH